MIPIRRGQLRHPVVVKTVTKVADGIGGYTETEIDYLKCRAAIWPITAKEIIQSAQLEMQTTHRIRMDYRAGITPDMKIYYGDRAFEIISIINVEERNRILDVMAKEF